MFALGKIAWFLLAPSNLLTILAAIGVALTFAARDRRWPRRLAAIAIAGLLVCGFSPLGAWLAMPLEARFPMPRPLPPHVDGVVVLGGALRPRETVEHDALSVNDAGDRLIALADLARRYPTAKIVLSGGTGELLGDTRPEADLVRLYAPTLGIDPARLVVEDRSRTTYENALYSRDLLQPRDGETWLLVTSAWHMPRAVGAFRQAGFPVIAYPVDFRGRTAGDIWRGFGEVALGLHLTDLMAKEWLGLAAYRLLGRTDALLPAPDRAR